MAGEKREKLSAAPTPPPTHEADFSLLVPWLLGVFPSF